MKAELEQIRREAEQVLTRVTNLQELTNFRIEYLGKKGKLTQVLRGMGSLPSEERPKIGQLANDIRAFLEEEIEKKKKVLEEEALNHGLMMK